MDVETGPQVEFLREYSEHAIRELWKLRQEYIEDPSNHAPLNEALALRTKLRANMAEQFQNENLPTAPAFLALEFFPCWFGADGAVAPSGGFDGIIGNPPWERFKPIKKEFAFRYSGGKAELRKYGMDASQFEKWFNRQLRDDEGFREAWAQYEGWYAHCKGYFTRAFNHQGTGDWNLYKLFIERDLDLIRDKGRLSLLVQSGFHTDEGTSALRRLLLFENTLLELTGFENKGYIEEGSDGPKRKKIFPDVHPQFKFGYFKVVKGETPLPEHEFDARSYIHDPKDAISTPAIKYSLEMVRFFSPDNVGIMEFRTDRDREVCTKLRNSHPLLGSLGYRFRRELHLTDDRARIHKISGALEPDGMPLFEGKTIFQFDSKFKPPALQVLEDEVRPELLRKEVHRLGRFVRQSGALTLEGKPLPTKKRQLDAVLTEIFERQASKVDYELRRVAYREVASSTNERSLIAASIPEKSCMSHKLMYLTPARYQINGDGILSQVVVLSVETDAMLGLLNSLVLNYYARNKVSTGVSVFQLNELPIPPLDAKQRERLAKSAARLSKKPDDLAERAQLEVFIARELYGLSREDWSHLTGTFTFGGDSDSKADLDEIIRLSLTHWS